MKLDLGNLAEFFPLPSEGMTFEPGPKSVRLWCGGPVVIRMDDNPVSIPAGITDLEWSSAEPVVLSAPGSKLLIDVKMPDVVVADGMAEDTFTRFIDPTAVDPSARLIRQLGAMQDRQAREIAGLQEALKEANAAPPAPVMLIENDKI